MGVHIYIVLLATEAGHDCKMTWSSHKKTANCDCDVAVTVEDNIYML